jgi:hypothetical protein
MVDEMVDRLMEVIVREGGHRLFTELSLGSLGGESKHIS